MNTPTFAAALGLIVSLSASAASPTDCRINVRTYNETRGNQVRLAKRVLETKGYTVVEDGSPVSYQLNLNPIVACGEIRSTWDELMHGWDYATLSITPNGSYTEAYKDMVDTDGFLPYAMLRTRAKARRMIRGIPSCRDGHLYDEDAPKSQADCEAIASETESGIRRQLGSDGCNEMSADAVIRNSKFENGKCSFTLSFSESGTQTGCSGLRIPSLSYLLGKPAVIHQFKSACKSAGFANSLYFKHADGTRTITCTQGE
jgi:hypothetical protein